MRLLVDNYRFRSLGGLQLQHELKLAMLDAARCEDEVFFTEGHCDKTDQYVVETDALCDPEESGLLNYCKWYYQSLPKIAAANKIDVIYMMSGKVPRGLQKRFGILTSVNNMIPFDPSVLSLYKTSPRQLLRYHLLRKLFVGSAKRADALIMHSYSGVNMLEKYTGEISSKVNVALTGIPSDIRNKTEQVYQHPYEGRPYLFYLSGMRPYKNHLRLIRAYSSLYIQNQEIPDLILAGVAGDPKYLASVRNEIRQHLLTEKVVYLGALERADIPAWFHHATVNVFPSLCETNSVILAEMLATGSVLACANVPSLVEVTGKGGTFFDPYSVSSISNSLQSLIYDKDSRDKWRRAALLRASELDWANCGRAIWKSAHYAKNIVEKRKSN